MQMSKQIEMLKSVKDVQAWSVLDLHGSKWVGSSAQHVPSGLCSAAELLCIGRLAKFHVLHSQPDGVFQLYPHLRLLKFPEPQAVRLPHAHPPVNLHPRDLQVSISKSTAGAIQTQIHMFWNSNGQCCSGLSVPIHGEISQNGHDHSEQLIPKK